MNRDDIEMGRQGGSGALTTKGPFFTYFQCCFAPFYFILLCLPITGAQIASGFASCGLFCKPAITSLGFFINFFHGSMSPSFNEESSRGSLGMICFLPVWFVFWMFVLTPLHLVVVILGTFFSGVIFLIPCNWPRKRREGLIGSYVQVIDMMAVSVWSGVLTHPISGEWDATRYPEKVPSKFMAVFNFFMMLISGFILPISDTVSDFLYTSSLYQAHLLFSPFGEKDLLNYTIASLVFSSFGGLVALYEIIRLVIGLTKAARINSESVLLYPSFQSNDLRDEALNPRMRTKLILFLGSIFEDAAQLVLLAMTSNYLVSSRFTYYFGMVNSIHGLSHKWAKIFNSLLAPRKAHSVMVAISHIMLYCYVAGACLGVFVWNESFFNCPQYFSYTPQNYDAFMSLQCGSTSILIFDGMQQANVSFHWVKTVDVLVIKNSPNLETLGFPWVPKFSSLVISNNTGLIGLSFASVTQFGDVEISHNEALAYLEFSPVLASMTSLHLSETNLTSFSAPLRICSQFNITHNPLLEEVLMPKFAPLVIPLDKENRWSIQANPALQTLVVGSMTTSLWEDYFDVQDGVIVSDGGAFLATTPI